MSNSGLFILGMHRSGTSLAAGLARLAGIDLGRNLLVGKSPENPRGFWEHRDLLEIDEAILRGLSLDWHVPAPLPEDWLDHPRVMPLAERAAATLRREFANSPAWAVKDPRLCRLSPFWLQAAAGLTDDLRAVHVVRDPFEVAASLAVRNRIPADQALELWLHHVVDVALHWQGGSIIHMPLPEIVADPLAAAIAMRSFLGLTDPLAEPAQRRIERFVERTLLHRPAVAVPSSPLEQLAAECHAALHRLAVDPLDAAAHATLAGARQRLIDRHAARQAARPCSPTIDVVVPVYRNRRTTLACIDSVLAGGGRFELIVIDDASPEPELAAELRQRADQGEFTLLANERNLGFVATANRGLALHPDRDVVLLNSDTVVPPGWLDRLAAAARGDCVGTVTPFSNNATIASYPVPLEANPLPAGWTLAELDAVFREANSGWRIDLPTAIGFCMYIRRDCLGDVGPLDEARFGRGYGEENDFSLRAAARGWRNVLAADLFVEHEGRASFGDEADPLGCRATETIHSLHPHYAQAVQRFLEADPLADARQAVDLARIERRGPAEARAVLEAARQHEANRLQSARDRSDELLTNVAELDRALSRAETLARDRLEETRRLDAALGTTASLAGERLTEIERLDRSIGTLERLATERLTEIQRLDSALAAAQTLAIERLAALESLDRQLRETASALAGVEDLARERLRQIEDLTRQVEVFTAGLNEPPGRGRQ
jgi:GT2 family glycosyltransferase